MSKWFDLEEKRVVIAGGLGLLGRALVEAFVDTKALVAVFDVQPLASLKYSFVSDSDQIEYYEVDISKKDSVKKAIEDWGKLHGSIDVLINCAYPRTENYGKHFEDICLEDWNRHVMLHLGGGFNLVKQAIPFLNKKQGSSIVNIGSIYGLVAPDFSLYESTKMTMPSEYAAIKGGVNSLTRFFASYLAKKNVRVNTVSPGGIFDEQDSKFVKKYESKVPLGRMATPRDICGAVLFLASDMSSYITGQNIVVDGGFTVC